MRVNELLLEAKRASLIEALRKNCSRNLEIMSKHQLWLLRGDTGRGQIEYGDKWWFESMPRTRPRRSQTEINMAMVWASFAPEWADVPRRAFASSCAIDYSAARQFGAWVYLIIPFDNVKSYAFCPTDFNFFQHAPGPRGTAPDLLNRLGYIHQLQNSAYRTWVHLGLNEAPTLKKLLNRHRTAVKLDVSDYTNLEQIWKFSDLVVDLIEYFHDAKADEMGGNEEELYQNVMDYVDIFKISPAAWLKANVTPKEMAITVHDSLAALPKDMPSTAEIWFEGQFIGITDPVSDSWLPTESESSYFDNLVKQVLG